MDVETVPKKTDRESVDDIVDGIKVMNAPQKTQPTVSRTGTTQQKQAVGSVRRKLDMESSAVLDPVNFPQLEAIVRAATSKSSSTSGDDDDDDEDDEDDNSDGGNDGVEKKKKKKDEEEEEKEHSSEKKKKTAVTTTTKKVAEAKKNLSPVPKVVAPKTAGAAAAVNNKRPRTATVNPVDVAADTTKQSTEEIDTAKSFKSDIAQLREKKQKLDESVKSAQKQLAEYTEINKTNVCAMQEIQRIEDSLVERKKELDAREEDIKRKDAGLEEMRAIAMKVFPKVTAASAATTQKK